MCECPSTCEIGVLYYAILGRLYVTTKLCVLMRIYRAMANPHWLWNRSQHCCWIECNLFYDYRDSSRALNSLTPPVSRDSKPFFLWHCSRCVLWLSALNYYDFNTHLLCRNAIKTIFGSGNQSHRKFLFIFNIFFFCEIFISERNESIFIMQNYSCDDNFISFEMLLSCFLIYFRFSFFCVIHGWWQVSEY